MTLTLPYIVINLVDCHEFNRLVKQIFDKPYDVSQGEFNPPNDTIVDVDLDRFLADSEEVAEAEEAFDAWQSMPASAHVYDIENISPRAAIMAAKMRERGVTLPSKFSIKVWW